MARIKYYYDTETCKYERVRTSKSDVFMNTLGILCLTLAMACVLLVVGSNYFESPREVMLKNEVKELEFYFAKSAGSSSATSETPVCQLPLTFIMKWSSMARTSTLSTISSTI